VAERVCRQCACCRQGMTARLRSHAVHSLLATKLSDGSSPSSQPGHAYSRPSRVGWGMSQLR
jgi:hypothetical protein